MQNEESLKKLAKGWIAYNLDPKNEDTWEDWNVSSDLLYDLLEEDPQKAWQMILAIHAEDQSNKINGVLSAGPVEDLLAKHGPSMIETIETHARKSPSFAKLLGGVWGNRMTEEVWNRVQAVWDRRGWDGIPEA